MSDTINDGGPAFPSLSMDTETLAFTHHVGMTLRDYFAAKAMQAYLSRSDSDDFTYCECAFSSYQMAEAMLKARAQ